MGAPGTDGCFATSAVAILATLRQNAAEITTILDVLVHDPLYRWMLSPADARKRQRDDDDAGARGASGRASPAPDNQAAERVLFKVKQKLAGYADASHDALSVEGQVRHLIADARDPDNLCRLFPGWAPWL